MQNLFRGSILNPISREKCEYFEDGALIVNEEGKIEFCGKFNDARGIATTKIIDTKGNIIIPAFCDAHIHLPQYDVRGTFSGEELLPWLQKYIWPEESKFISPHHSIDVSKRFYKDLIRNGTLTAAIFGTIHEEAVRIMFEECPIRAIIGKVIMNQNSPAYLSETTKESLEATENLCKYYAHRGNTYFAVTPRFAPTCSMEVMKKAAIISQKYNTYIQTHLNENKKEIKWVADLFPDCKNYTDVYRKAGLLGTKTIVAHSIYSTNDELDILKNTGTGIAHCPSSNIALNSGIMPIEKIQAKGIQIALATDVGAGPNISMFDVIRSFLNTHKNKESLVNIESGLYYATLSGAELMGFDKETGNLQKGKSADFIILNKKVEQNNTAKSVIKKICLNGSYDRVIEKVFFKGNNLYSR